MCLGCVLRFCYGFATVLVLVSVNCSHSLFLLNGKKSRAYRFQFLYALTLLLYLILIDMIDYANCITSASSSFNSSIDKEGT